MTEPRVAPAGGPRASLERLRHALEAGGFRIRMIRPTELMALCPSSPEKTPSMHATWKPGAGQGGYTLVYCHSCGAGGADITAALGLTVADLYDEPLPQDADRRYGRTSKSMARRQAGRRRGKLGRLPARIVHDQPTTTTEELGHQWRDVAAYPYVDGQGRLVQEVLRKECFHEDGTRHKEFRQVFVTADGRRVHNKPDGFRPVLYHAAEVTAAVSEGRTVWLVEGEKDADTARTLGVVATTNAQGGRNFPDDLIGDLAGAAVNIVLDRDATGWARGLHLNEALTAPQVGARVALKLPAVVDLKADLTDHVEAGYSLDQLLDVHVLEVAAWDALAKAQDIAHRVRGDIAEARARKQLADAAREERADADAGENERFAVRWTMQAQIEHEALADQIASVLGHGLRVGTEWAAEAIELANQLLTEVTAETRRCHEELGVAVPPSLRRSGLGPGVETVSESAHLGQVEAAGQIVAAPWSTDQGAEGRTSAFRIMDGQIVQWEPERSRRQGDDEADAGRGTFKVLLSTVVRVTVREYLEVEGERDQLDKPQLLGRATSTLKSVTAPRALVAVRLEYIDPLSGEVMEIRISAEQWRDHSWLESLPAAPDYDHRKSGLDQLQRAILAVSDNVRDEVLYRATGWREQPDGSYRFVHRRGSIGATGHLDGEVALSGPLERYDLPDPVADPATLRTAWLDGSVTMLDRIPDRVAAPLLGQVFRAVLGHNPWVLVLVGPPGSYKTSLAAKVMHHFGEQWEHSKPASSMSGNGDTLNALRFKLHNAKDVLYWMDDFAPTKSWLDAQRLLEETARLIHNQEERSRSSRDGLSVSDGTGPRASGLCTSEVMPRPGSGSERLLVVPLAREDIDTRQLFPLDDPVSRHQRALVMASFLAWLADGLRDKRLHYRTVADSYADQLAYTGQTIRQAAALANTYAGWTAVCDFLLDRQAITEDEHRSTLQRVDVALQDAGQAAINPDMPRTTGARVRELLGYALRQGLAHVDDVRTGDCPPWPLARQLGWRKTVLSGPSEFPAKERFDRSGVPLGFVCHDPGPRETRGRVIMCESTQLEAALRAASATQAEKLEIDRDTACRALFEEGVLLADTSEGRTRHTLKCTIYAEGDASRRMVVLRLDDILGGGAPDTDHGSPPPSIPGSGPAETAGPTPDAPPHAAVALPVAPAPAAPDAAPAAGTDEPCKEEDMPDLPVEPTAWVDRNGVIGWTEPGRRGSQCVVCGLRCVVIISGVSIHPPCWQRSTAEERGTNVSRPQPARSTTSPPRRPEPVTDGFRAAAAVADLECLWLSNGECVPWPFPPSHVGHLDDIANQLRLGTAVTKYWNASGQIWVTEALAASWGIDVAKIQAASSEDVETVCRDLTKDLAFVTGAVAAGYRLGGGNGDALGRWTRIWRETTSHRSTYVRPTLITVAAFSDPAGDTAHPLTLDRPEPRTLARRIGLLAQALGFPYQQSAQTTGLDHIRALRWKDRAEFFSVREPIPPAKTPNVELDPDWCRKPTAEEMQQHTWVHAYDRSGSYLAGVSGLELPVGDADHHPNGCAFTPRVPGYWLIEVPDNGDWRMPNPLDPTGRHHGRQRWMTTPSLEFALEQGYDPEILEAYTWPKHARVFDPWYERCRDARMALDKPDPDHQAARDQLKWIYATTIGILGSERHMAGREGYAPDRRHHIVAKARANLLRRVVANAKVSGQYPVAVQTDTLIYTSAEPDPVKAWPGDPKWLGRELGRYKPEGSSPLEDQLPFLTGGNYKGKDALKNWAES